MAYRDYRVMIFTDLLYRAFHDIDISNCGMYVLIHYTFIGLIAINVCLCINSNLL